MIEIEKIRKAIAEYMYSEGCSCCRNISKHEENIKNIAKLLGVEQYSDGSGYNFMQYIDK